MCIRVCMWLHVCSYMFTQEFSSCLFHFVSPCVCHVCFIYLYLSMYACLCLSFRCNNNEKIHSLQSAAQGRMAAESTQVGHRCKDLVHTCTLVMQWQDRTQDSRRRRGGEDYHLAWYHAGLPTQRHSHRESFCSNSSEKLKLKKFSNVWIYYLRKSKTQIRHTKYCLL